MTTYKFTLTTDLPMPRLLTKLARLGNVEAMLLKDGYTVGVSRPIDTPRKKPFDLRKAAEKGRRVTMERRAEHLNTFREIVAPYLAVVPRASGKEISDYLLKKGFRTVRGNRFTPSSVIHALHTSGLWSKGAQGRKVTGQDAWDRGPTNGLDPADEAMVSMLPPWED